MDRESGRAYVDDEAEIVKARDEALREFGLVTTIEVGGTEVAIIGVVAKHVVRSGEHRGGYREDGFLGSPTALDAQELRAEVAVLLPRRGPRGLHQGGLEPRIARACAIGQTFTGALMQPGTEPGPRHEMSRAGEAGHIEADLGDDHARHGFTDAGHGDQAVDGGTKLLRISPWAKRSAIQVASLTSLLRPGMLRMCMALARTSSKSPSRRCQTGFQYTPLDSMATCVQPRAVSQSLRASNSGVLVPKVRTS